MMCMKCKEKEIIATTTTYFTQLENCYVIIEHVPCMKCEQCGEKFYTTAVMERLEYILDKLENKEEPLTIDKRGAGDLLRNCGVEEDRVQAFEEKFDEVFGEDAQLHVGNLTATGRTKIETPEVTVQVKADGEDVIETREIGGIKYVLIRADHGVTVNGVNIEI